MFNFSNSFSIVTQNSGAGEELALFKRSGKEVGVVWCNFSAAKKLKILGKAVSFLSVN